MMGKRRSIILTLTALTIAFVIVIAVLMYSPQAQANSSTILIKGQVTDEAGRPIANATIRTGYATQDIDQIIMGQLGSTSTNSQGQYSIELDPDQFTAPCTVQIVVSAGDHWMQVKNLSLAKGQAQATLDLTLSDNVNVTLPLGPMVLATMINGSTQLNISSYFNDSSITYGYFGQDNGGNIYSLGGGIGLYTSFITTSSNTSLSFPALEGFVSGTVLNNGSSWDIGPAAYFTLGGNPIDPNFNFARTNVTLSTDYIDPKDVIADSQFYLLSLGQSKTITVAPQQKSHSAGRSRSKRDGRIRRGERSAQYELHN